MSSPKFEITGTVHAIPPPRDGKYYTFVLATETDSKYPQAVPFDCKADLVGKIAVGDEVTVSFNVRGREWKNPTTGEIKFFGSVQAWKVDITKRGDQKHAAPPPPNGGGWGAAPGDDADIPF